MARELTDTDTAWLAVAILIMTTGFYGAYSVFHYSELYLTARSLAEALVVTALAAHFRGWRRTGLSVTVAALFIHPLMALPGLLLLICLWLPERTAFVTTATGVLGTAAIAFTAVANRCNAKTRFRDCHFQ